MTQYEIINRFIESKIEVDDAIYLSPNSAPVSGIFELERSFNRILSPSHRRFLGIWDGIKILPHITILSVCDTNILRLNDWNSSSMRDVLRPGWLIVATGFEGYQFIECEDGTIISYDTDGGEMDNISEDFKNFVVDYVFGKMFIQEYGDKWMSIRHAQQVDAPEPPSAAR
jgi:hypothetical protein